MNTECLWAWCPNPPVSVPQIPPRPWFWNFPCLAPGRCMSAMCPAGGQRFHGNDRAFSLFLHAVPPSCFQTEAVWFPGIPQTKLRTSSLCFPPRRLSGLCGGVLDPSPRPGLSHLLWQVVPGYSDSGSSLIGGKNRTLFFKWNLYFGIVRHAVNKGFILLYFDISKASSHFRELKKPSDPKTVQQLGFS